MRRLNKIIMVFPPVLCLLLSSSCARLAPGSGTSTVNNIALSGKRLHVTMVFRDTINPLYFYYFLIDYSRSANAVTGDAGDKTAAGPIPVIGPLTSNEGYGNGFATGSTHGTTGFTDFVEFSNGQYSLWHVSGDPNNPANFVPEGQPIAYVLPQSTDGKTVQFDIDLSQLLVTGAADPLYNATTTISTAKNVIQYLEINMIATNVVPTDQTTTVEKEVEALGDTRIQQTNFLILDVSQIRTTSNGSDAGTTEPADDDVIWYPATGNAGEPSVDLIDWSISVTQQ